MSIEFKKIYGDRVGYITGTDVKNNYGTTIGYIDGDEIKDAYYKSRVGFINENEIINANGYKVGFIDGDEIKDVYGNRVGYPVGGASKIEMAAAAILLFGLKPKKIITNIPTGNTSSSEGGCLPIILGILAGIFFGFLRYFSGGAFDFKGTANRKEWWVKHLLLLLIVFITGLIFTLIITNFDVNESLSIVILSVLVLFELVPAVAISVRRMHDIDKPWWWILIPGANFIMCAFFPGKEK